MVVKMFQRENIYNRFLPYFEDVSLGASTFLSEIQSKIESGITSSPDMDLKSVIQGIIELHKFIILYGLRFDKKTHLKLIHITFRLFVTPNIDTANLEIIAKVFGKKKIYSTM